MTFIFSNKSLISKSSKLILAVQICVLTLTIFSVGSKISSQKEDFGSEEILLPTLIIP